MQVVTPEIARAVGVDAEQGAVVGAASANSDAGRKGLRRGDVIVSVNRTPVATSEALAKAVADAKKAGRDAVLLEILRRGGPSGFVAIRVNKLGSMFDKRAPRPSGPAPLLCARRHAFILCSHNIESGEMKRSVM